MTSIGPIATWNPGSGTVTRWAASPASRTAAAAAPLDELPPSPQQAQHLRIAQAGAAVDREMPRLIVSAWDIEGVCDIAAMTEAINVHVRRHDTYRSTFTVTEAHTIERRTIEDPEHIDMIPSVLGVMSAEEIREHVLTSTPGTLEWDCFTFGVIQNRDHFTVYTSIDHLHLDLVSAGLTFLDIHLTYQALVHEVPNPLPPITGYREHTARQQKQISATTVDSPEIRGWIDFLADGGWPNFPLPLGDRSRSTRGGWVTLDLLDAEQTTAFETACRAAGARFSGGVMACAALADHRLTGKDTFHGFTPSDTRTGEEESLSVGWFGSIFPVSVPIGDGDFSTAARTAQESFDANRSLAAIPVQRALELAAADSRIPVPDQPPMMLSYMDFRRIPVSGLWQDTGFGVYGDNLSYGGINLWVNRQESRTTVTVSYPDNDEARNSVHRYLVVLRTAFVAAARNGRLGCGHGSEGPHRRSAGNADPAVAVGGGGADPGDRIRPIDLCRTPAADHRVRHPRA